MTEQELRNLETLARKAKHDWKWEPYKSMNVIEDVRFMNAVTPAVLLELLADLRAARAAAFANATHEDNSKWIEQMHDIESERIREEYWYGHGRA